MQNIIISYIIKFLLRNLASDYMDSTFKHTPEDELILYCARTQLNEDFKEKIRSIVFSVLDWEYIIELASYHRLNHFLYFHLNSICPEKVPDEVMLLLKNYFDLNLLRNLFMFGKLIEILDVLRLNEIDSLPYKGPILAFSAYNNLALREFADLDIFVHKKDVSKIRKILMSIGYNPTIELSQKEEKKFIRTMRDYIFYNDENRITLEIHWRFPSIFFSLPNTIELFNWEDCKTIDLQSNQILTALPEDMLLILCIHNAEHRWKRISLLCDLKEFLNANEIDWPIIIDKSKKLGVKRILGINIHLTNELLGLTIPDHIFEELISDKNIRKISLNIISQMFLGNKNSIYLFEETLLSYKLRENKVLGIKDVIRGATFPGILEWKNIRLPVVLFPLYYLLRPFLLLKRHLL